MRRAAQIHRGRSSANSSVWLKLLVLLCVVVPFIALFAVEHDVKENKNLKLSDYKTAECHISNTQITRERVGRGTYFKAHLFADNGMEYTVDNLWFDSFDHSSFTSEVSAADAVAVCYSPYKNAPSRGGAVRISAKEKDYLKFEDFVRAKTENAKSGRFLYIFLFAISILALFYLNKIFSFLKPRGAVMHSSSTQRRRSRTSFRKPPERYYSKFKYKASRNRKWL